MNEKVIIQYFFLPPLNGASCKHSKSASITSQCCSRFRMVAEENDLPGELKPVGCTEHTYFISKLCHNFNSVHAIILETCVQTSNIQHSWGHSFMYTCIKSIRVIVCSMLSIHTWLVGVFCCIFTYHVCSVSIYSTQTV